MTGIDSGDFGADALDFWLGRWTVSWAGGTGTNTIRRILDGRVIEEDFACRSDDDGSWLYGRSLSTLDTADGRWRQTWVDSSGAYLDFVAVAVDGQLAFARRAVDGAQQRMVWTDRTGDSFRWLWQRSQDDGANWHTTWALDYRRVDEVDG